ncbi:MAG: phage holin family protein [Mycobacteriaceae bacterium]|nr:phage holin family protein [Mycobacteriaceae bacterium]
MTAIARLAINMVAIWLAARWVDGIRIATGDYDDAQHTILVLLGIAVVFALVNALIKPLVKLLSLPLVVLTLGLFLLVVNALMLKLTAWITESTKYGLRIEDFWPAILGAVIITLVNWVLGMLIPDGD